MNDQTPVPVQSRDLARPDSPFAWLRNEVDRLFSEAGLPSRSIFSFGGLAPQPALELADKGKDYQLTAELPGLNEDDVELTIADGVLTLSGEKREESDRKEDGVSISERRYGSFTRQVRLPHDVDPDKVRASISNGVLTVTIGKDADSAARTRKIAIGKA